MAAARRRTSHEVRGLKYAYRNSFLSLMRSHLTRGAWIEISSMMFSFWSFLGRTSHEVRGLKYLCKPDFSAGKKSHLTRGAWIEM